MKRHNNLDTPIILLKFVSYGLLVFSAIWWSAALPFFDAPASLLLDTMVWPIDGSHDQLDKNTRLLSAIGAGLLVSQAVFFLYVVIPELKRGNTQILRGTTLAVIAWFVVDSVGSVSSGVMSNVVFNSFYLVCLIIPLRMAARQNQPHQLNET